MLTAASIAKSYLGIGCMAMPFGFHTCGYQLALALITFNAFLSYLTSYLVVSTANKFGLSQVRTFADLGRACYGPTGYFLVASLFLMN